MTTLNLQDVAVQLPQVLATLGPGEQLMIVDNGEPLATLTRTSPGRWPCRAGSAKETDHWMAPDFDAPLDEFAEYAS